MKENLKPYAYKQIQRYAPFGGKRGIVLFVERAGELRFVARLSDQVTEPK